MVIIDYYIIIAKGHEMIKTINNRFDFIIIFRNLCPYFHPDMVANMLC